MFVYNVTIFFLNGHKAKTQFDFLLILFFIVKIANAIIIILHPLNLQTQ